MFSTFATTLSFHHQQLSSSSPFPRSRLTSTRKQRSSMTTAKFILPGDPTLNLLNIHLVYTFLFSSMCHASRFWSCFLLQGLVIQAHLWLSPMVPIGGTLWHCRQSLVRICRDRKYLHDMFQHFPRKRNSRTVKFLTLVFHQHFSILCGWPLTSRLCAQLKERERTNICAIKYQLRWQFEASSQQTQNHRAFNGGSPA